MFLMDMVLAAWPSLYPSAALIGGGGGFKTPPGKEGCLGFRRSLSREGRELLRRGQIGPEADQRSGRVNVGQ